jgi:hypothetical protein
MHAVELNLKFLLGTGYLAKKNEGDKPYAAEDAATAMMGSAAKRRNK